MSKVTWRHPKPEEQTPPADEQIEQMKERAARLMPIAKEVAEALQGDVLAMYLDERNMGVMRAVFAVEEATSLAVVDLPINATSVADAHDDFEHYCSGLDLAEELLAEAEFSSHEGRNALVDVLANFDKNKAFKNATRWMQLTMERKPPQPPTEPVTAT